MGPARQRRDRVRRHGRGSGPAPRSPLLRAAGRDPGFPRRRDRPVRRNLPVSGSGSGISPSSRARMTASVRLAAPSLPRTWLTCFLTVSKWPTSWLAMARFDFPAASIVSTSSSRLVSCSTRPGTAAGACRTGGPAQCSRRQRRAGAGPGSRAGPRGVARWPDQSGQQSGHRRPLVGEDPDIARGQASVSTSARAFTASASWPQAASACARSAPASITLPTRSWATAAAYSRSSSASAWPGRSWASRIGLAPSAPARVCNLAHRPGRGRSPAGNGPLGQIALGQQQPGPLGGNWVEQAAGPGEACMARRSPPAPRPDHRWPAGSSPYGQAVGQRGGVDELAA